MSRLSGLLVAGSLALAPSVASSGPPSIDPSPFAMMDGGSWIAYQGGTGDSVHLRLVRPDGTGDHALSAKPVGPEFHPDWSHDGGRLAFVVDDADSRDIWVANADGSNARRVFDCVAPCVDADGPAWSPDDGSIAFRTFDQLADGSFPGSKLQVMEVASGTVTTVASTDAPDFIGNGTGPRWSGDGRKLVTDIATIRDAGADTETVDRTAIAVADLDDPTHGLRRITDRVDFPTYPDWHPTEDLIVFMAMPPDPLHPETTPSNLFTVRSDGSEVTQLTHFGTDRQVWGPTWAPDGASILVTILGAEWTLGRLTQDGSALVAVPGPLRGAHPRQRTGTIAPAASAPDAKATVSPPSPDPSLYEIAGGEPWIAFEWVYDAGSVLAPLADAGVLIAGGIVPDDTVRVRVASADASVGHPVPATAP
jgi:dipeptidyl aminopeptidase/acylaminoacyl peptidase